MQNLHLEKVELCQYMSIKLFPFFRAEGYLNFFRITEGYFNYLNIFQELC